MAGTERLTIFAGAGISKDSGSPDWKELVVQLLTDRLRDRDQMRPVAGESARLIVDSLGPIVAASVVRELFDEDFGRRSGTVLGVLTQRIHDFLYSGPRPVGPLLINIARLAVTWKSLGRDIAIMTTNFDDNLEQIADLDEPLQRLCQERGGVRLEPYSVAARPPGKVVPVFHLNGLIPRNGDPQGQLILSERAFATGKEDGASGEPLGGAWQSTLLERWFRRSTVLFIGTSLTDPLVVRTLARSMSTGQSRYATFAVQGDEWWQAAERVRTIADLGLKERLLHLGVEAVRPDFFGQIPQLLHEVTACASQGRTYSAPRASYRYGQRLTAWWKEWDAKIRALSFGEAQDLSQRLLGEAKREILSALPPQRGEKIKLEVWVRRKPSTRRLRLWCSSEMTWRSADSMHEGRIMNHSDYVAVRAFCRGYVDRGSLPPGASRWKTYLSLPIILEGDRWERVPVGVINLLSMLPEERSSLGRLDEQAATYSEVVKILDQTGKTMLDPATEWPG